MTSEKHFLVDCRFGEGHRGECIRMIDAAEAMMKTPDIHVLVDRMVATLTVEEIEGFLVWLDMRASGEEYAAFCQAYERAHPRRAAQFFGGTTDGG